jgi:hypothetical protein
VNNETDIAWLAGIIDGEGCFSVKNPVKTGKGRHCHQVWIVVCNTNMNMIVRVGNIIENLGCARPSIRKVMKDKVTTHRRHQYWIHVARKVDVLRVAEAVMPHLTAKRIECAAVIWYFRRACKVKFYKQTALDKTVLTALSKVKGCSGEAPAEEYELLREVIPSEVFLSIVPTSVTPVGTQGKNKRVETTQVSLNNNPAHECPTPKTN